MEGILSYSPQSDFITRIPSKKKKRPRSLLDPIVDIVGRIEVPPIDRRLYDALEKAEHRSRRHRRDTWMPSGDKTSTAWGPVQINDPTMSDLLRHKAGKDPVQSARWIRKNDPLTKGEEAYIRKYTKMSRRQKTSDLKDSINKSNYNNIAKKYIKYLWEVRSKKDPKVFATLWHYGQSSLENKAAKNKGKTVDIVDKPYWEQFMKYYGSY
tara:strand:- start:1874 stop:2503 length:630 start_codon:yes stop_codon:yes gene_type:complete